VLYFGGSALEQIGNPESPTKPNKSKYDPRMPLRSGEESQRDRLVKAAEDLNW